MSFGLSTPSPDDATSGVGFRRDHGSVECRPSGCLHHQFRRPMPEEHGAARAELGPCGRCDARPVALRTPTAARAQAAAARRRQALADRVAVPLFCLAWVVVTAAAVGLVLFAPLAWFLFYDLYLQGGAP